MPPKSELSKELILAAAFAIVQEEGLDAVTARSIAGRLKCSTQPIYSLYENMDALKEALYGVAIDETLNRIKSYEDANNSSAMNLTNGILLLAHNEKNLFKMVFLTEQKNYYLKANRNKLREELMTALVQVDERLLGLDSRTIEQLFLKLSIYIVGIGTMININTFQLDIGEAERMVIEMFDLLLAKEGILNKPESTEE
ncbi:TetR/AcrR family transcriptional regulator [Paenibacillus sacheonensis]|uniref:TetR family transcriptional regulator n=1 Tax=Paenibacillus sacheonensis TaxID=742054 RepID=A0A7X4YM99_9BACL|nr:TetR family transcriptional regulator [Paenibacillus sacheonensis]MBM7564390.1 AcrR family transcriptional regulator [Paenibacillus sacheonensis]NBC68953.1 TetR family transcriptional regulator [Paenibacillus sacheonensis]